MDACIGPSGSSPAYGDSWGGAGGSGYGLDIAPWGIEELWYWPTVFETAATAYADARFPGPQPYTFILLQVDTS